MITRYDFDAIHMDDYFYPYPVDGLDFPDSKSYKKYGEGMDRGDWRVIMSTCSSRDCTR